MHITTYLTTKLLYLQIWLNPFIWPTRKFNFASFGCIAVILSELLATREHLERFLVQNNTVAITKTAKITLMVTGELNTDLFIEWLGPKLQATLTL